MRRTWLLPESPDVLGMLHEQFDVTLDGVRALHRWAGSGGDEAAALDVRRAEHRADDCKLRLRRALVEAFSTPLDSEDLYMVSELLDNVMNGAKDAVREAELMGVAPDGPAASMAGLVAEGVEHLAAAADHLVGDGEEATAAADAATKCQRRMEKVYRAAMSDLRVEDDLAEQLARRELYRRLLRVGEHLVAVAERVWYAVLKES